MSDRIANGSIELSKTESTGIATICMNNVSKRNAMSLEMIEELSQVITQLELWTAGKFVIIYGKNGFFSSGADLAFVRQSAHSSDHGIKYSTLMHSNLSRLAALPMLTVAAVDGQAIGGGAEILTACDMIVMTRSAKIGFVQIRVGVTTGWSGGSRLVHRLGHIKALDLLMSGNRLSAEEALDVGLVSHVFADAKGDDLLLQEVSEWLQMNLIYDKNELINYKSNLMANNLRCSI